MASEFQPGARMHIYALRIRAYAEMVTNPSISEYTFENGVEQRRMISASHTDAEIERWTNALRKGMS